MTSQTILIVCVTLGAVSTLGYYLAWREERARRRRAESHAGEAIKRRQQLEAALERRAGQHHPVNAEAMALDLARLRRRFPRDTRPSTTGAGGVA